MAESPSRRIADRGQLTKADAVTLLAECEEVWVRLVADESRPERQVFRLELSTALPPRFEDRSWDYGTAWFRSLVVPGQTVSDWMASGTLDLDGRTFALNVADTAAYERLPAHAENDRPPLEWPYVRAAFSHAQGTWMRPETGRFLVAPDAPSFPSYDMAAEVFFHGERLPNSTHNGDLVTVRFVDRSARLARIAFSLSAVDVQVEGDAAPGCRVELVADGGPMTASADSNGHARFDLPAGVPREWWAVASQAHEWLDFRHFSPYGRSNAAGIELPAEDFDPADELSAITFGGEGTTTEFKRQLPEGGDEKRKLARTIAAFANADGGVILFGIDKDELTVVGIEQTFPEARDLVTGIVAGIVTPRPPIEVKRYEVDGRLVVGLHVAPGEQPLYGIDQTNPRYYIRRGASTFPARPDEVAALVVARQRPSDSRIWPYASY